ncbi:hypothetical protein [Bifidobacterium sp. ESL0764]|uniref:hypothetical protein n=1 Tax=Bifidobacterium sp. ESL0764 TaxID=2983228 RepID=UPI0023F771F7|nr:hypothetical protein [Bifidobacterium sp. ESL0764]WEV65737.1 hypothetical protein OZX71_08335 [Bifidobacterium sp. ESL0764]
MRSTKLATRLACAVAVLAMICAAAIPASVSVLSKASPISAITTQDATRKDLSWRYTTEHTVNGADRQPKLYKVLGQNNRVDTQIDELRLDFVLRVAHNEVDPTVPGGGNPGLRIVYDYGFGGGATHGTGLAEGEKGDMYLAPQYKEAQYLNTYGGGTTPAVWAADAWAQNDMERFTIHSLMHSGPYDYLVISLTCDLDIINDDGGNDPKQQFWNHGSGKYNEETTETKDSKDGAKWFSHIYAIVGPDANNGTKSDGSQNDLDSSCMGSKPNWTGDDKSVKATNCMDNSYFATNVVKDYPWTVFPGSCQDNKIEHGCDMPVAQMPYDQHPYYWSGGQANWGLVTDYGLGGHWGRLWGNAFNSGNTGNQGGQLYGSAGASEHYWYDNHWRGLDNTTDPGTAPRNSFSVFWYDPARKRDHNNPCYNVTSFKYQWVALQNGNKWVPVDALTPTPQVAKQLAATDGNPPTPLDYNPNGSEKSRVYDHNSAANVFNSTKSAAEELLYDNTSSQNKDHFSDKDKAAGRIAGQEMIARKDDGTLMPAQNADGSIDFKLAKKSQYNPEATGTVGSDNYQGLDGYFKLISWPVLDNSCTADAAHNPKDPGVTDNMNAEQAQAMVDSAATVGTAFYKFDVARPLTPTIDSVSDDDNDTKDNTFADIASTDDQSSLADTKASSSASTLTIKGKGTKGYKVVLYEDNPNKKNANGDYTDRVMVKNAAGSYDNGDDFDLRGTPVTDETGVSIVGTAEVGLNGTWTIKDTTHSIDATDAQNRVRRYHAYQYNPADEMQVGSHFSPIALVNVRQPADAAPSISSVAAPHTTEGALASGDNTPVEIKGKVSSTEGGSTLKVYATHVDVEVSSLSEGKSAKARSGGNTVSTQDNGYTANDEITECGKDVSEGANQDWTCKPKVSWFKQHTTEGKKGCQFHFTAVTTNADGVTSEFAKTFDVNFYAPKVTITGSDSSSVSGKVEPTGPALAAAVKGAKVTITWPTGSATASSEATVKDDGTWTIDLPTGTKKGSISAMATESAANNSNESAKVTREINPIPPLSHLPFTGNKPWLAIGLCLAVLAAFILGYFGFKRYKAGLNKVGRHVR